MAKEEQDKIDKTLLGKKAGNMLIRTGLYTILLGLPYPWNNGFVIGSIFAVMFADVALSIISLNKLIHVSATTNNKGTVASLIILFVVAIGVGLLFFFGEKDPTILVQNNSINVQGMYGIEIPFEQITSITLIKETMNEIGPGRRTNGFGGLGQTLKGNFQVDTGEAQLLFVQANTAPTIQILRDDESTIYISLRDSAQTQALFKTMQDTLDNAE